MNNLQIGKMYLVKELFWFLFPAKEMALRVLGAAVGRSLAYRTAKWIGEQYNCNVCVVEENTCVVLLEQDEAYFKILDSKGNVGWVYWRYDFSHYFELVKE